MHEISSLECSRIAQDLQIRKIQVEGVVQLLQEGNSVPFLACFRRDRTGGLSEDIIRQIKTRVNFLKQLADRKQTIIKSIESQGKLTEKLREEIVSADTSKRLDDLYLPFKAKKKSPATQARDRGLDPLAVAIWNRDPVASNLDELLPTLVDADKGLSSVDDVRNGVQQILAEMISEVADVRAVVRKTLWETGKVRAGKNEKLPEGQGQEYKDYFEFSEPIRQIPAHRILALNRGEKENALKVTFEFKADAAQQGALKALAEYLETAEPATVSARPPKPAPSPTSVPAPTDAPTDASTPPVTSGETATVATGEHPPQVELHQSVVAPESPASDSSMAESEMPPSPETPVGATQVTLETASPETPGGESPAEPSNTDSPAAEPSTGEPSTAEASAETPEAHESAPAAAERSESAPPTDSTITPMESGVGLSPSPEESMQAPGVASGIPAVPAESAPAPQATGETPTEAAPLVSSLSLSTEVDRSGEPLFAECPYVSRHSDFLRNVLEDSLARLIVPSLEKEIRNELTAEAEAHAVSVFARNLRSLLMQPPLSEKRVLAIDPGLRNGCRLVALDESGQPLENVVVFPFGAPAKKGRDKAKNKPAPDAASTPEAVPSASSGTESAPEPAPSSAAASETPPETPAPESTAIEAASSETATPAVPETPAPETPAPEAPSPEAPSQESPTDEGLAATGEFPHVGHAPAEAASSEPTPSESSPSPSEQPTPEPTVPNEQTSASSESVPVAAPTGEITSPAAEVVDPKKEAAERKAEARAEAKAKIQEMIGKHNLHVIALGNGTGCRETEELIAELIGSDLPELSYVIVNEAGASVYSVSAFGREEFPNLDSGQRATVSIGRRLQDPLSELVKVDPPNIGVGLYQHDISRKDLKESLEAVVESCVNQVGVEVNTGTVPLLRHISGLNQLVAREIVDYRKKNGPFTSREQLQQVPGLAGSRFTQSAGFLKIHDAANPLDRVWVHPENYALAEKVLTDLGFQTADVFDADKLSAIRDKFNELSLEETAQKYEVDVLTLDGVLHGLAAPGSDPRHDLPPPIFKKGILKFEDLQPGMELKGTVLNVVDFGAFVDIGLKDSGLVHISQMANRYIKSPYDVVAVSDVVTVWVLQVDQERHRVSLTMIKPGTERKPTERRGPREQREPREQRGGRPPREGDPGQSPDQRGRGRRPGGGRGRPQQGRRGGPGSREGQQGQQAPAPKPLPPRKPRRELPKPKLSQEALEGKAPLRTFGELSVLFAVKKEPPQSSPQTSSQTSSGQTPPASPQGQAQASRSEPPIPAVSVPEPSSTTAADQAPPEQTPEKTPATDSSAPPSGDSGPGQESGSQERAAAADPAADPSKEAEHRED